MTWLERLEALANGTPQIDERDVTIPGKQLVDLIRLAKKGQEAEREIEGLERRIEALEKESFKERASADAARLLLSDVQWSGNIGQGGYGCPVCEAEDRRGAHFSGCRLAALLPTPHPPDHEGHTGVPKP